MKLQRTPELLSFLSTYFSDSDPDSDQETARSFATATDSDRRGLVIAQIKSILDGNDCPVEEFGTEANRWFGDEEEARAWLRQILTTLEGASGAASAVVVKDSNGTPLDEGDSVQVIKDLKVKGGSSDLKRGTLIKKIHLTDDSEAVECRVDGSTLVLKTCFLKKV